VVYSVIEAPKEGWDSPRTLGGLAVGALLLAGFMVWELRQERPLLDPRYFRKRPFAAGTLSITVQFLSFFGFIFVFLQYLQLVRGDSALAAALALLPMPAGLMPAARLAPRLVRRFGTARLCGAGLVMVGASLWWLSRADAATEYWILAVGLFVVGAGMGLAMTPATTAITDALPSAEQGVASAMNDLSRELGGALGIAVLGSVSTSTYRSELDLAATQIPEAARESLAVATTLGEPVAGLARNAFVLGMEDALMIAAVTVVAAAVAVVALLSGRRAAREHPPTAAR
jgi:Na+/melibiose symporter-like transporter